MALQTRELLQKTEEAIKSFIKDDLERTLPLIKNLEEISYQLWKENNMAFLDDETVFSDDESEGWFWDEDVFYDERYRLAPETPHRDKLTYVSDVGSNCSSLIESSVADSALYSAGYLTSCESSLSETTFQNESANSNDNWIVISNELAYKEDHDWLLVSVSTNQEQIPEFDRSDFEESNDWMVLSVTVKSSPWKCDGPNFTRSKPTCQTDSASSESFVSSIRRRLFLSPDCDSSFRSEDNFTTDSLEDSQTHSVETCATYIPRAACHRTFTDVKIERNTDWDIVCKNKAYTERFCHKRRPRKGELSSGNLPRFAAVT